MTLTTDLFEQAQLALAAYADLATGSPDLQKLRVAGLTLRQADRFIERYRVVTRHWNSGNGLSATVFTDANGQNAKLKLAAFQFQKYGMVEGKVAHVNADATEAPSPNTRSDA